MRTFKGYKKSVEDFRRRADVTAEQAAKMEAAQRRRAFWVTGVNDLDAIAAIKRSLADSSSRGEGFAKWKKRVLESGAIEDGAFTDARLRTIFQTNMMAIHNAGRYAAYQEPRMRSKKPYWRFEAVLDSRTTPGCREAHGTILRYDDPWWQTHTPPLHYNCRSTIVALGPEEALGEGISFVGPDADAEFGFGGVPDPVPSRESLERTPEEDAALAEARAAAEAAESDAREAMVRLSDYWHEAQAKRRLADEADESGSPYAAVLRREADEAEAKVEAQRGIVEGLQTTARAAAEGVPMNWEPSAGALVEKYGATLASILVGAARRLF